MGIGTNPNSSSGSSTVALAANWSTLLTGGGECTLPRPPSGLNAGLGANSQRLRLIYFQAMRTESISRTLWYSGTTAAAATPTLVRFGVYLIDQTTFAASLIASTVNDTTLMAATNTAYTRSFSASFTKTAGLMYALGMLVVTAAAAPTTPGVQGLANTGEAIYARFPRVAGFIASQSDLPASYVDASVTVYQSALYAELLP